MMKWTFQEYMENPAWFIAEIIKQHNEEQKQQQKSYGNK